MTTMHARERWRTTSIPGVVVLVVAVAWPLRAEPADARPARSTAVATRLKVAWPKEAVQAEAAFVADINGLRASRGLPVLQMRPNLTEKARQWASIMAAERRIWHSRISAGVVERWRRLGENVGRGASEPLLHAAFVASDTHLDNLVDPMFRYVGVGVVAADGIMFVSQVFMQPSSTAFRGPVRSLYRAVKPKAPVQQQQQEQRPLRPLTATPGLLFRMLE